MHKIIDSNYLQDPRLKEYLAKSPNNYAVLTDYVAMEAYKGETLSIIYRSMEIVAQHPKQVIILKGTKKVAGMAGRKAGLQRRLIDPHQTSGFSTYCRLLLQSKQGDPYLVSQLLEHRREARKHMEKMLDDMPSIATSIEEIEKLYTAAELSVLRRKGTAYTEPMLRKFISHVLELAAELFHNHPNVMKIPNANELPNTFIFRVALCSYILALQYISTGGTNNVKYTSIRNHIVDINFAAYATYFDGILTDDKKLTTIYAEAIFWLQNCFHKEKDI